MNKKKIRYIPYNDQAEIQEQLDYLNSIPGSHFRSKFNSGLEKHIEKYVCMVYVLVNPNDGTMYGIKYQKIESTKMGFLMSDLISTYNNGTRLVDNDAYQIIFSTIFVPFHFRTASVNGKCVYLDEPTINLNKVLIAEMDAFKKERPHYIFPENPVPGKK